MGMVGVGSDSAASKGPPMSLAQEWAARRAEAVRKAQKLREDRAEDAFGGRKGGVGHRFLEELAAVEKREDVPKRPYRKSQANGSCSAMAAASSGAMPGLRSGGLAGRCQPLSVPRKRRTSDPPPQERRHPAGTVGSEPARELQQLGFGVVGPIAAGAFSTILRARAPSG